MDPDLSGPSPGSFRLLGQVAKPTNAPVNANYTQTKLLEGDTVELEITSTDADGMGVAPHGNVTCHVAGGFPGERVLARVTHVARQRPARQRPVVHAVVVNIVRPHLQRRRAPCSHHESRARTGCSGCPLMLLKPAGQHAFKQERLAKLGLTPDRWVDIPGAELGYRWSSKRVAQGAAGRLMLGSYVRGTHRIADMITCLVEHPLIQACAMELQRLANDLRIAGYEETTREGELRYVWLKTNGTEVLVTLIAAREITPAMHTLAEQLTKAAGVHASVQSDPGNAIRGEGVTHLRGKASLTVELAGVQLELGPLGFLQPNPAVAALAYRDLCQGPNGDALSGSLALDVYAGAGATTRQLRTQYTQVIANDMDPESAALLGVPPQDASAFLQAQHTLGHKPDLIVCNPPRGGMGAKVCEQLTLLSPARIHIMSCNPETLARDLKHLESRYTVEATRAYDTLPQTWHVEVVTWLVRNS